MSDRTEISWADSTFNPWMGCTKVSPACDHCYAERDMDKRLGRVKWGAGQPRVRTGAKNWNLPLKWNSTEFYECGSCGWRGEEKHTKPCCGLPYKHRRCPACDTTEAARPTRRRVFCASLADVFDNEVPRQWRLELLRLIANTPNLDWLLLTKRIGNAHRMLDEALDVLSHGLTRWADIPWPNVWIGATVVNQDEADRDIPKLLCTPAAVRFVSMEPLLGPVSLRADYITRWPNRQADVHSPGGAIDWVIAGGESGTKARPMHPDWVRNLRDECAAAGVAFHFKQWGGWEPRELWTGHQGGGRFEPMVAIMKDGTECPHDVAPQDVGAYRMARVGKAAAGRLLDLRFWDEFPKGPV
jgi:protein gp37